MAARYTVATKFTGDSSDLKRATGEGSSAATKLADDTEASRKRSNIALAGIAVGAAAMAKSWVDAATESQQVGRQTEAVIRSTGGAAKVSAKDVDELSASLSRKTGIDDEAVASGENVLLTFTKVRNEAGKGNDVFTQATKLALDMSVALGSDLAGANILLGKALNDPIKGISALSRAGVSFTAEQKDQIRTLVESGKTLDAQKIILRELSSEFEGSAEAQATASGKLKVALGNVSEELGGVLLPAVEKVADGVTGAIGIFEGLPKPIHDGATEIASIGTVAVGAIAGIGFLAEKVGNVRSRLTDLADTAPRASGAIKGLAAAGATFIALDLAGSILDALDPLDRFDTNKVQEGLLDLNRGMKVSGELAKIVGDDFGQLDSDIGKLSSSGNATRLARGIDDLTSKLTFGHNGSSAFDEAKNRIGQLDAAIAAMAQRSLPEAKEALHQLREELGPDRYDELYKRLTLTQSAFAGYRVDAKLAADGQGDLNSAVDGGTEANETYVDSIQRVIDATLAQFDSNLAYRNAVDQTGDAVAELAQVTREHGRNSEEYGDKLRDVEGDLLGQAAAAVRAAEDQAKANGTTLDAKTKAQVYRDELVKLQQQFPALRDLIQSYIDKLNEIPSTKSTTLTVETREARNSIARSKDAEHRAGGGPVKAGHLYLVGEEGPEPFIPDQDGTILPHSTIARGGTPLAATGSTPEVHLHFDLRGSVNTSGDITRVIAEGVQRARDEGYPI